jgi:glutamate-1-semialdehyde aminotransferase
MVKERIMTLQGLKTRAYFERAKNVIPYGVNSCFHFCGEEDTLVIERGDRSYVWDTFGRPGALVPNVMP